MSASPSQPTSLEHIEKLLSPLGLIILGGFYPNSTEESSEFWPIEAVKTVLLISSAGPDYWRAFGASSEFQGVDPAANPDPMNRWTERVIGDIAKSISALPIFPFTGPPFPPFQNWSRRTGQSWTTPLRLNINKEYGLWHAYRAALAFKEVLPIKDAPGTDSPCLSCIDQPCMTTCPVTAFTSSNYDVSRCVGHLNSNAGRDCVSKGCLARRSCPVGNAYQYSRQQAEFHMRAFIKGAS